ncbi:MAG: DUF11 domain-containing protein [Nitrosomonadales bacterium]|nr:DUF11 domain-containing protein [Nitrosomonadales bacterium]
MKSNIKTIFLLLGLLAGAADAADTFTTSGTWVAPAGVTSVDVEVWGGGGAGGGQNQNSDGGGGGGGGAYSRVVGIAVVPGNSYTVTVGAGGVGVASGTGGTGGDSYFINAATVMAKGGTGGAPSTGTPPAGGAGGAAAAGVGTTKFSGGNGGQGINSGTGQGGPGGSSAGTAANGTNGPTPWATLTAAAAPAGGGIGGNGGNVGVNGFSPASGNGGGGGGSGEGTARVGGSGTAGKVVISYISAPAAATSAATGLAASGATLNGVVSSNGASTTVTFEYGLDTSYGNTATAAQSPLVAGATNAAVSAAIIGLTCNTTYHFRVTATNSAGTTNGGDLTFTTSACPLAIVTTNAASAVGTTSATLNGTVNDNGSVTTVTFDYGLTAAYGSTATAAQSPLAAGSGNTAVSSALLGLACNTTYHFRVKGVNAYGTSNGGDLTFTTVCTAPAATTSAATTLTTTGATLNGTINDNGASATVSFDYGLTAAYGSTITATQSPVGPDWGAMPVSAALSGLPCNTTYHYRVKGTNSIGTTNGGDLTVTTLACSTGVSVTSSPGACVDDAGIGTRTWTTLDAVASDNAYATTTLGDNQQSHYLKCTGYGFAIPAGATINGITVNVERSASNTNSPIRDLSMRIVKAGVIGATNRATATTYPTTDTVEAHGGAADLWGLPWTAADINSANFGAALAAYKNGTNGGTFTVNVDHMPITVTYTPTTPWVASIDRVSTNPTAANMSVSWDVLFSGNATGVDATDFELIMGGAATGASITSVSGSGMVWTVTANTGTGATGTLGLNLADNDSITVGGVPLGGAGDNADFTGQVYTIEVPVCDATAIFCDDFERSNVGAVGNGWTITPGPAADCAGVAGNSGCAGIDTDIPPFNATTNKANPTRSMFTRWSIVTVDSRAIDLSGRPSALLSFWMRRGGDSFSEYPEAVGEDYLLQYLANDGTWKILAQYPTGVMQGQVFTPVIQLPTNALHANFKLRYYQPAGSGDANGGATGGAPGVVGYDYWHIDNVIVREAPESSYVGAFCDNFEAGLGRWSISAEGAPPTAAIGDADLRTTDFNSATHELDMRWGYVVASTLRTDMTGVTGNIEYWLKSGTTAARDPDANEDMVVEYRNSAGTWTALATYLGSDPMGTIYNGSHVMPADSKHTGFRLRFRMLNGSSFDNDYWHVDDVCVGTILPVADLSLSKTRVGPLVPGSNGTYTLSVTNNGPDALAGTIEVVDTLPAGLSYYSATGTGWSCTSNAPDVTCSYVGTLNNGATAPAITLIVAVDPGASGTITNTATVTGTVTDSNLANNTASNTATLTPGFVFTNGPCVSGQAFGSGGQTCSVLSWTSLTAGQDLANVYITAVNTSSVPTQLSGAGATIVNMEFGLTCHNPAANAGVQATFSATASALALCESNGAAPTAWTTGVDLSFAAGSPSVGPYTFNYADVGQIELYARNSAAATQVGTSGPFVMRPAGFVLSAIERSSDNFPNPGAATAAGAAFVKAGEQFSVTVTAVNSLGDATPNYGKETTPESVMLTPTNVIAGMVPPPAIGGTFATFVSGAATGTVFTWDEIGIITLTPRVFDSDYLGAGNVTGTVSGNVGRFYPDHFDTVVSQVAGVPMNCPATLACPAAYNGIVYSGQTYDLSVTARSVGGGTTANYNTTTGFSKTAALSAVAALGTDAAPAGAGALGFTSATAFVAGVMTTSAEMYTFTSASTGPTDVYVRAVDTDAVSSKRLTDPTNTSVEGGVKVVSGRIKVSNAYGSELLPLSLIMTAQYYTATGWMNSITDSVTSLTVAATYDVVRNGATTGTTTPAPTGATTLVGGQRTIVLGKPSGGATGAATVAPAVIGCAIPATCYLPVTAGTATFGVYRSNNNFIYRREN